MNSIVEKPAFAVAFLLFATALAFGWALTNGFVYDDIQFILNNRAIHNPANFWEIWQYGDTYGTGMSNPYYRPITTLTFFFNAVVLGDDPFFFHLVNIIFHMGTVVALYFVLRKLFTAKAALVGALLYALHPSHAEAVSYISARGDLICGFFMALSFLFFLKYREENPKLNLSISAVFLALATFSKILAVLLPFFVMAYLYLNGELRARWKALLIYLVPVAIYLVAKELAIGHEITMLYTDIPLYVRVYTAGVNLATMIISSLFPVKHVAFYRSQLNVSIFDADVVASWAMVTILAGTALWQRIKRPMFSLGILWWFVMIFPVCGIVALMYPSFIAERYLYIPLMGVTFVFASFTDEILLSDSWARNKKALVAIFVSLAFVFGLNAALRTDKWANPLAFWNFAYKTAPIDPSVLTGLSTALMDNGDPEGMARIYSVAEIYGIKDPVLLNNMAVYLAQKGQYDEALRISNMAIEVAPKYWATHSSQGLIFAYMGDLNKAEEKLTEALRLGPNSITVIKLLEDVRRAMGKSNLGH